MPRSRSRKPTAKAAPRRTTLGPHALFSRRLAILTTFFVLVGLVYGGILVALQARGNAYAIYVESPEVPDGGTTMTVTVQAMRGEIYDRNGKPLVTNVYSYDLTLDRADFMSSGSLHHRNELLLSLLDNLARTEKRPALEATDPFAGSYPDLTLRPDLDSTALDRVLARIGLDATATADDLVSYYLHTYSLDGRTDGIPMYDSTEIDALLRVYYDMDATQFSNVTPYTVAHDVSAAFIAEQMEKATPGVHIHVRADRVYHYPGYASHLLGRVGRIFAEDWAYYSAMGYPMNAIVGVSGCESAFENILHGTDGEMRVTLDAEGRVLAKETLTQPIAGRDIRLTIDIDAQIAAEDALRAQGTPGSVVAMDSETGELLVLASAPTYDTADFATEYETLASAVGAPLVNRALSTAYPIGDLAHLITATAGLSEGAVRAATLLQDTGETAVGTTALTCHQYAASHTTHGSIGVATALRESCDVVMGAIGVSLGNHKFSKWETALGLGAPTGIELAESAGKGSGCYPGTDAAVAAAASGQSDARMTPAQLASMLSTVLTGGKRYAAHLLSEVRDFTSGDVVYRKSVELLSDQSIRPDDLALLARAMKNDVLTDSASLGASQALRAQGMEVGRLGTQADGAALSLVFASPATAANPISDRTVAVVAVLDKGASVERADAVALDALTACY